MNRTIKLESAGKDRNKIIKTVVFALRELMKQQQTGEKTRDLVAYISESLHQIAKTIEPSVIPWEKRGYWVKADRFRLEWEWAEIMAHSLEKSLADENWAKVAALAANVGQKLANVKVAQRSKIGEPWDGCWKKMDKKESG